MFQNVDSSSWPFLHYTIFEVVVGEPMELYVGLAQINFYQ